MDARVKTSATDVTAGRVLADALIAAGAVRGYCVPGESYLGLLDALYDRPQFQLVSCRHEGGAGFMAVTEARLSGLPGIVMASRGPGVSNVMIAAHVAQQDGVPLLLLVGQVPKGVRHRGAFQEVDYAKTFADIAKLVIEVNDSDRIGECVAQAWTVALAGRPGPVVLSLHEDMLLEPSAAQATTPRVPARPHPAAGDLDQIAALLAGAHRPLVIAGESLASDEGRSSIKAFAERWRVPVLCGHKLQDLFPNRHPNWAGHIGHVVPLEQRRLWESADLILAAGSILGDIDTQGYELPAFPVARQTLIQIHHDPLHLARHYQPTLAVCADAATTLRGLADLSPTLAGEDGWVRSLNQLAVATTVEPSSGPATYAHVLSVIDRLAASDCIFTMDSGRFASAAHRLVRYGDGRLLIGTASGAMGNGVPAAVAAAVRYPGRQVVAIVGDGGLLMTGNELATAARENAAIRILVVNNARYGAIASHQNNLFPGRAHAMELKNPDLVAWARSFDAAAFRVAQAADVESTVAEFLNCKGSALLEIASD